MRTFKDTTGQEWEIAVPVSAAKRVRQLTGVDLYDLNDGSLFHQLDNPITLVDVLYVLCKPQADARGVDDLQFGSRVPPAALEDITDAIVVESAAMLYPAARREAVLELWRRIRELRDQIGRKLVEKIQALDLTQQQ
jgi:hypothetical protein